MATEDLVPKGLPQGERQRQVAGRRRAGLPLETSPNGDVSRETPFGPVRRVRPDLNILADTTPADFPNLGVAAPATGPLRRPQSLAQEFATRAAQSQNATSRLIANRLARRLAEE